MNRGEIWLAGLDPTVGMEIKKTRPCMIVSPQEMTYLGTVLVAPMTTGSSPAPFRVPISFRRRRGLVLLDQIRAIDKARLIRHVGAAKPETLHLVLQTLQDMFAQ